MHTLSHVINRVTTKCTSNRDPQRGVPIIHYEFILPSIAGAFIHSHSHNFPKQSHVRGQAELWSAFFQSRKTQNWFSVLFREPRREEITWATEGGRAGVCSDFRWAPAEWAVSRTDHLSPDHLWLTAYSCVWQQPLRHPFRSCNLRISTCYR